MKNVSVSVIMGSDSDLPIMKEAINILNNFGFIFIKEIYMSTKGKGIDIEDINIKAIIAFALLMIAFLLVYIAFNSEKPN